MKHGRRRHIGHAYATIMAAIEQFDERDDGDRLSPTEWASVLTSIAHGMTLAAIGREDEVVTSPPASAPASSASD